MAYGGPRMTNRAGLTNDESFAVGLSKVSAAVLTICSRKHTC